jgi:hypothetical protein
VFMGGLPALLFTSMKPSHEASELKTEESFRSDLLEEGPSEVDDEE